MMVLRNAWRALSAHHDPSPDESPRESERLERDPWINAHVEAGRPSVVARDENGLPFDVVVALVDVYGHVYLPDERVTVTGERTWLDEDGSPVFTVDAMTLPGDRPLTSPPVVASSCCGEKGCTRCARIARGETCSAACAGFYIDEVGVIRACDACGLHGDDTAAGERARGLLSSSDHDSMVAGWAIFDSDTRGPEIDIDDEAGLIEDHGTAIRLARAFLEHLTGATLAPRLPRSEETRRCLVQARASVLSGERRELECGDCEQIVSWESDEETPITCDCGADLAENL